MLLPILASLSQQTQRHEVDLGLLYYEHEHLHWVWTD